MIESATSLQGRMRRRLARRLSVARTAKVLLVPTVGVIYVFHHVGWLVAVGFGVVLCEIVAIMVGEAQRCPLCETSLVIRRDRTEEFAHECPECGFLID